MAEKEASGVCSYKSVDPIRRGATLMTSFYLNNFLTLNVTAHWVRASMHTFLDTNFQPIAYTLCRGGC